MWVFSDFLGFSAPVLSYESKKGETKQCNIVLFLCSIVLSLRCGTSAEIWELGTDTRAGVGKCGACIFCCGYSPGVLWVVVLPGVNWLLGEGGVSSFRW